MHSRLTTYLYSILLGLRIGEPQKARLEFQGLKLLLQCSWN